MSDAYLYERLSEKNFHDLLTLFNISFNEKASLEFLKKKYETSIFGEKYIGFLAYSPDRTAAAYYGVFPILVKHNDQVILAAQSGDTMTHPAHRGKGLFIKLANLTYDLAKEKKIHFIFGFPNKNSYPGFVKKLNWKHYSNINHYRIKTGSLPFDKAAKKWPIFKSAYNTFFIKRIQKQTNGVHFENSIAKQMPGSGFVLHDKNFFDYKTYYNSILVNMDGVNCWLKIDGRMWIGDIEFCDEQKFSNTVEKLTRLAKSAGCSTLCFSFYENSLYDKWLKTKYDPVSQDPIGCLDLSSITDPTQFAYQAGDFDTF